MEESLLGWGLLGTSIIHHVLVLPLKEAKLSGQRQRVRPQKPGGQVKIMQTRRESKRIKKRKNNEEEYRKGLGKVRKGEKEHQLWGQKI
jgi:hypothetical protein